MARAGKWTITLNGADAVMDTFQQAKNAYGKPAAWIVGVGVEYGAYVEFGTSRNRAQPYLFPAADKVMRTDFKRLEKACHRASNPTETLVESLALAIEREAKRRAPVDTGALRSSIEAAPAEGQPGVRRRIGGGGP